jgi:hypothetical protein
LRFASKLNPRIKKGVFAEIKSTAWHRRLPAASEGGGIECADELRFGKRLLRFAVTDIKEVIMAMNKIVKAARKRAKPFRVTDGDGFRLKDFDPGDTLDFTSEDKRQAMESLAAGVAALASLDLKYPKLSKEKSTELGAAKRALLAGK